MQMSSVVLFSVISKRNPVHMFLEALVRDELNESSKYLSSNSGLVFFELKKIVRYSVSRSRYSGTLLGKVPKVQFVLMTSLPRYIEKEIQVSVNLSYCSNVTSHTVGYYTKACMERKHTIIIIIALLVNSLLVIPGRCKNHICHGFRSNSDSVQYPELFQKCIASMFCW